MPQKTDIESRKDINKLVLTFYHTIQQDEMLGPIFNGVISDWDAHYTLLTDFWTGNLFAERIYFGNPIEAHQEVDEKVGGIIESAHFGQWLMHWFQTIDQLFEGKNAEILKRRARKMSTFLFLKIVEARDQQQA